MNSRALISETDDSKGVAKEILRILDDDNLRNELSFNAREVRNEYSPSNISKMWIETFKEILC